MAKFKHLSKTKLNDVCHRLFLAQSSLNGIGSLFEFQSRDACYSQDELFGMGQALKLISTEINSLEEILRHGKETCRDVD